MPPPPGLAAATAVRVVFFLTGLAADFRGGSAHVTPLRRLNAEVRCAAARPRENAPARQHAMTTARPLESDRVRRHTTPNSLRAIDENTRQNIRHYGVQSRPVLDARIQELDRQWDMERVLETNASLLALTGAVLGLTVNRKWFWLTGGVLGFLAQHALMGWCPPVPAFRRLGVRTQNELDQEKYALKLIRGDFAEVSRRIGPAELPPHAQPHE